MKYKKGTFITVPNKAVLPGLKPNVQSVYLWLCSHIDDAGTCFPSWTTIAREAGICKRMVPKCIDELIAKDLLEKKNRYDKNGDLTSNLYTIKIANAPSLTRPVGQTMHEGGAAGADITKSPYLNKEEDISSNDDPSFSSFKKQSNKNKSETYLLNEAKIAKLLEVSEFTKSEYDFPVNGPYDWRYVINRGVELTPERAMLGLYWKEKDQYVALKDYAYFEMSYTSKDVADAVIKRDLKDARQLASGITFSKLYKLIEIANDKAYNEEKNAYWMEWKLSTLLKYIEGVFAPTWPALQGCPKCKWNLRFVNPVIGSCKQCGTNLSCDDQGEVRIANTVEARFCS